MDTVTLAAFCGIASLIIFHELGHWLVARSLGLKTVVFSIGFGSKNASLKIGRFWETEFRLGILPFGGYVSIPELHDEETGRLFLKESGLDPDSFVFQPIWKRALVVVAGPLANIVLAYLLYVLLLVHHGLAPLTAMVAALSSTANALISLIYGMAMMLHLVALDPALPPGATDLHSVVGIFQLVQHAAGVSIEMFARLLAYLSLNLAVINLAPLPVFDGGQLVFLSIEKLAGKPLSSALRTAISITALVAIIFLTGLGLFNDFTRPVTL